MNLSVTKLQLQKSSSEQDEADNAFFNDDDDHKRRRHSSNPNVSPRKIRAPTLTLSDSLPPVSLEEDESAVDLKQSTFSSSNGTNEEEDEEDERDMEMVQPEEQSVPRAVVSNLPRIARSLVTNPKQVLSIEHQINKQQYQQQCAVFAFDEDNLVVLNRNRGLSWFKKSSDEGGLSNGNTKMIKSNSKDEFEEIGDVSVPNTCLKFGEFSSDGSYFVFVHGNADSASSSSSSANQQQQQQQHATIVWNGSIVSTCSLPSNGAGEEQSNKICGLGFIQTEQDLTYLVLISGSGRVFVCDSTDDFHSIREIEHTTKSTGKKDRELDFAHVLRDGRIVFVYSCSVEICLLDLRTFKLIPFQSLATFSNDARKWMIRTKDFIRNALGMRQWRDFFRVKRSRVSKDGSMLVLVHGTQKVCVVDISSTASKSAPHIVSMFSSPGKETAPADGDSVANLVTTKMDFIVSTLGTATSGTQQLESSEEEKRTLKLAMVRGRNVFISGLDQLEFKSVDHLASTSSSSRSLSRTGSQTMSLDQSSIDDISACSLKPDSLLFVTRNGEVGRIKESTREEIVWQLLETRDYSSAMDFCRANNLSVDFVHKRIFESSPISSQSIQSHLALIEDREWVLTTCAERIPAESLDLCLELLRFGQQQVDSADSISMEQRQFFKTRFQELIERTEAFQVCFTAGDLPNGSSMTGQEGEASSMDKFDPQALRKFREGRSALDLAKRMAGAGKINELLKFVYQTRFGGRVLSSASSSKEEQIQLLDAVSEVVSVESYSQLIQDVHPSPDWFIRRCTEMENKTGLIDQVFPLVNLGLSLYPDSSPLDEFKRDFEAFVAVALEFDSISFSKWKSMSDLEKLRAIWSTCGSKNLVSFESKSRLIYPQGVLPPAVAKNWLRALREFILSDLLSVLTLEELAALLLDSSADFYYRNRLDGREFLLETARDCLDRVSLATDSSQKKEVAIHRRIQEMKSLFERLDSMKDDTSEKAAAKHFLRVRNELNKVKSRLEVFERCFVPYFGGRAAEATQKAAGVASIGMVWKNTPVIQCLAQLQSVDESFVFRYIQDLTSAFQHQLLPASNDSKLDMKDVENVLYLADYAGVNSSKVKARLLKQIFIQLKKFDLARAWIGQQQNKDEEWLEHAVIEAAKEFLSREDLSHAKQTLSCLLDDDAEKKKHSAKQRIWGLIEFLETLKQEDELVKQELVSLELLIAFEKDAPGMLSNVLLSHPQLCVSVVAPSRPAIATEDDFPFDPSKPGVGRGRASADNEKEGAKKMNVGSTTRLFSQVKKKLSSGMSKFNVRGSTTGTTTCGSDSNTPQLEEEGLLRKLERWSSMLSLSIDELDWVVCEVVLKKILLVSSDEHMLGQARTLIMEWMSMMDSRNESSKLLFDALWSFSLMTKDAGEASKFRAEALLRAPYMSSKRAMELVDNLSRFNDQYSLMPWSNLVSVLLKSDSLQVDAENVDELERIVLDEWFEEDTKKENVAENEWKLKCFASWLVHRELLHNDSLLNGNLVENAVETWKSELLQGETISQSRLISILIAVGTLLTFYSPLALSQGEPLGFENDPSKTASTASKANLERVLHSVSNLSSSNQTSQKGKRRRRSDWMKLLEEYLGMSTEQAEFVLGRCRFVGETLEANEELSIGRLTSTTQGARVSEKAEGWNLEDILGDLDEQRFITDAIYRFQFHQSIGRWIATQMKLKLPTSGEDFQTKLEETLSEILNTMRATSGLSLSANFGDWIRKSGASATGEENDPFQLLLSLDCAVEINSAISQNRSIQLRSIFVQAYYSCVEMVVSDSKPSADVISNALRVFDLVLRANGPQSTLDQQQVMNGLDFTTSIFISSTNGSEMINEDDLYFDSSSSVEMLLFKLRLVEKIGSIQADVNQAFKSKIESRFVSLDEFLNKFFLDHIKSKGASTGKKRSLLAAEDSSPLNEQQLIGLLKQAGVGRPAFDSSSPEWIFFAPAASVSEGASDSLLIAIGELFALSSSISSADSKSASGGTDLIRFAKLVCEVVADPIKLRPSQVLCSLLLFLLLGAEGLTSTPPTMVPPTMGEEVEEEDVGFVLLQTRKIYESKCRSYLSKLVPRDLLVFAQRTCFSDKVKFNRETRLLILNDCLNAWKRVQARKKSRAASKSAGEAQESEKQEEQQEMVEDEKSVQQLLELMRNVLRAEDLLASDPTLRREFNQIVTKAIQTHGTESPFIQNAIRTFALDFLPHLQLDVLQLLIPNQSDLDAILLQYFSSSLPESKATLLFEVPTSVVELMNEKVSSPKEGSDALVLLANMVRFGLADPARLSAAKVDEKRDRVRRIIQGSGMFQGVQDWQSIHGKIHSSSEASMALEILNVFVDDFVGGLDKSYPGSDQTSTLTVEELQLMSEIYLEALSSDFRIDVVTRLLPLWSGDQVRSLVERVLTRLEKYARPKELLEVWEFVLNHDATFQPCESLLEQKARETAGNSLPLLTFLGRYKLAVVFDIWKNQTLILRSVLEANSLKFSQSCARVFAEWILLEGSEELVLEAMAEHRRFPKILLASPANKAEFARLFFSQVLIGVENQTSKLEFASFQEQSQAIELLHNVLGYLDGFALKWRDDRMGEDEEEPVEADFNEDELMKRLTPVKPKSKQQTLAAPSTAVKAPEGEWAWGEPSPMTTKSASKVARDDDEFEIKAKPLEPIQQAQKQKKRLGLKAKRLAEPASEVPIAGSLDLLLSSASTAGAPSVTTPSIVSAEAFEEPKKASERIGVAKQKPASSADPLDLLLSSGAHQHSPSLSAVAKSKKAPAPPADAFDLLLSSNAPRPPAGTTVVAKPKKAASKQTATKVSSEEDSSKLLDLMAAPVIGLLSSAVASWAPQAEADPTLSESTKEPGGWDVQEELDLDVEVDVEKPKVEKEVQVFSSKEPAVDSDVGKVEELLTSSPAASNELPTTIETVGQAGWDDDLGIENELDVPEKEVIGHQGETVESHVEGQEEPSRLQKVDEPIHSVDDAPMSEVIAPPVQQVDLEFFTTPSAASTLLTATDVPPDITTKGGWDDDLRLEESADSPKLVSNPVANEFVTSSGPSGADLAAMQSEAAQTWANDSLEELTLNEENVVDQQKGVEQVLLEEEQPLTKQVSPKLDEDQGAQAWADDSLGEVDLNNKEEEPPQLERVDSEEEPTTKQGMDSTLEENDGFQAWADDSLGELVLKEEDEHSPHHRQVVSEAEPKEEEVVEEEEEPSPSEPQGFDIERDRPKEAELYEEEGEEDQSRAAAEPMAKYEPVTGELQESEFGQQQELGMDLNAPLLSVSEESMLSMMTEKKENFVPKDLTREELVQNQVKSESDVGLEQADLTGQLQQVESVMQQQQQQQQQKAVVARAGDEKEQQQQEKGFAMGDIAVEASTAMPSASWSPADRQHEQQEESGVGEDNNNLVEEGEVEEEDEEEGEEQQQQQQQHLHHPHHALRKATSSTRSEYVVRTCPDEVSRQVAGWLTRADLMSSSTSSSEVLPKSSADDIADLAREQTRLSHRFVEQTNLFSANKNNEDDHPSEPSLNGKEVFEDVGADQSSSSLKKYTEEVVGDQRLHQLGLSVRRVEEIEEQAPKAREEDQQQQQQHLPLEQTAAMPSISLDTKSAGDAKASPKDQDPLALLFASATAPTSTTHSAQATIPSPRIISQAASTPSKPFVSKVKSTAATTFKPVASVALNVASDDPLALLLAPSTPSPKPASTPTTAGTRKSASKSRQQQQHHEADRSVVVDTIANRGEEEAKGGLLESFVNPASSSASTTAATKSNTPVAAGGAEPTTKKIAVKPRVGKSSSASVDGGARPPAIDPALDLLLGGGGPSTSTKSTLQPKKSSTAAKGQKSKEDKEPTKDEFLDMISGGL